MITRNKRIRFCDNNFITESNIIDYSSSDIFFPYTNCAKQERTKLWKPTGNFEITTANNKLYINDGADKIVTIPAGQYESPSILAQQIQTQLNTVSSDFTVTYSASFKFVISRSSAFILSLSNTTNSIGPTIGFTSTLDIIGTTATANVVSIHTSEYLLFDFGYSRSVDFASIIGPIDEVFSLSSTAVVTIKGDNINDFSSPAFTKTIPILDSGAMCFIDDADSAFRYWKLEIVDSTNNNGPALSIGHIYLGDYRTLTSRNLENGFTMDYVDNSKSTEGETGILYFDQKPKYKTFSSMTLGYLERDDRKQIMAMFEALGLSNCLYVSLDPTGCFSDSLDEFTAYCLFSKEPSFRHIIRDIFSVSVEFREAV